MKLKLKRVAPLQAGKMLAGLYLLGSLLVLPIMMSFLTMARFAVKQFGISSPIPLVVGLGIGFILLIPAMYAALGFVVGVVSACIYNLLAKFIGGFEVEFEQESPPPAT